MTNEEAIKILKQWNEDLLPYEDEKEGIECHNIAISALEKQIPKKLLNPCGRYFGKAKGGNCPCCGAHTNSITNDYCRKCGQKLLWE